GKILPPSSSGPPPTSAAVLSAARPVVHFLSRHALRTRGIGSGCDPPSTRTRSSSSIPNASS
ncbi:unnamed protein product, partial [Closterium sp. NIES-53]